MKSISIENPNFDQINFLTAIEFYIDDEIKLPKQVRYAIRLGSSAWSTWSTASTYPSYQPDGPRQW